MTLAPASPCTPPSRSVPRGWSVRAASMRKSCRQNLGNVQLPTLPLWQEPAQASATHSAELDLPFLTMSGLSGHRLRKFSFWHRPGEHQPGGSAWYGSTEGDGRMPGLRSLTRVNSDSREEHLLHPWPRTSQLSTPSSFSSTEHMRKAASPPHGPQCCAAGALCLGCTLESSGENLKTLIPRRHPDQ